MIGRLFLGLALVATCGACSRQPVPVPPAALPQVTVDRVRSETMTSGLSASGRLVSREEIAIASELAGYRVARVLVEEDALVRAGQVLAVLDDGLLRPQIAQQRAAVAERVVARDKARAEAGRVSGLDDLGVLAQEAIDQRRLAVRTADASLAMARAQLDDLLVRERRLAVRAPRSGRILERTVKPGDTSSPGTTMFLLGRDDLVELDAELLESAIKDINVGESARVELASGRSLTGRVRLLDPRVDARTSLVNVRIGLPIDRDLRPGGFARAIFVPSSEKLPTVPESAIRFDANGASLLLLDKGDHVRRANIRTGQRAGGRVELASGPPPGTRIVLTGGSFLLEGDKVVVQDAAR